MYLFKNVQSAGGGGGGVMGMGAAGQNAFWTAANTIAGDNNHWWNNATKKFGVGRNFSVTPPNSTLEVAGSLSLNKVVTTAVNYAVLESDFYIGTVPAPPLPITITIPSGGAANIGVGKIYLIKDQIGAAAAFPVTIAMTPGDLIDGAASKQITQNFGAMWIMCIGVGGGVGQWAVI